MVYYILGYDSLITRNINTDFVLGPEGVIEIIWQNFRDSEAETEFELAGLTERKYRKSSSGVNSFDCHR